MGQKATWYQHPDDLKLTRLTARVNSGDETHLHEFPHFAFPSSLRSQDAASRTIRARITIRPPAFQQPVGRRIGVVSCIPVSRLVFAESLHLHERAARLESRDSFFLFFFLGGGYVSLSLKETFNCSRSVKSVVAARPSLSFRWFTRSLVEIEGRPRVI